MPGRLVRWAVFWEIRSEGNALPEAMRRNWLRSADDASVDSSRLGWCDRNNRHGRAASLFLAKARQD